MKASDKAAFAEAMTDVILLYGKDPSERVLARWFEVLADCPLEAVQGALLAHQRDPERGRFMPVPADVIAQIEKQNPDGRPTGNEAWSLLKFDEASTFVWTAEMAQAWGLANEVMPDKVAARMAFRDHYDRLVEAARAQGVPVRWSVSLGSDMAGRADVVARAQERGLLPATRPVGSNPLLAPPQQTLNQTASNLVKHAPKGVDAQANIRKLRGALKREGVPSGN